jgi:tellurite resistance-related uncharacterized protein
MEIEVLGGLLVVAVVVVFWFLMRKTGATAVAGRVFRVPNGFPNLEPYRTVGPWAANEIPAGLRKDHKTRKGVFGLAKCIAGEVEMEFKAETVILHANDSCWLYPEELHAVKKVSDDTVFSVTFHKN